MNIAITKATTAAECMEVAKISEAVTHRLQWHKSIDSAVDPLDMRERTFAVARAVLQHPDGLLVTAKMQGKLVGHLLAWPPRENVLDPYQHHTVQTNLKGRHISEWKSLCAEIDSFLDSVEEARGPFMCMWCVNACRMCF